jgi:hypothetical protein
MTNQHTMALKAVCISHQMEVLHPQVALFNAYCAVVQFVAVSKSNLGM